MSADGTDYEYPDEAGYPDGMGTLHEGTDDAPDAAADAEPDAPETDAADADEKELDHFAMEDEEDDDEGV
ncbi:hypothetical protein ACFWN7_02805 [Agromyces sp. NPDC058484]|uniref:hypothetical protein n=1 Tax=Agromyces sp. NPDC058484 TaxID=3346524 RepID=UPI0036579978